MGLVDGELRIGKWEMGRYLLMFIYKWSGFVDLIMIFDSKSEFESGSGVGDGR